MRGKVAGGRDSNPRYENASTSRRHVPEDVPSSKRLPLLRCAHGNRVRTVALGDKALRNHFELYLKACRIPMIAIEPPVP